MSSEKFKNSILYKYKKIIGKHAPVYLLGALTFVVVIFFRTVEPKVVQIAIDRVIAHYADGGKPINYHDSFTNFICRFLPDFQTHTILQVLIGLGGIFLFFAFMRCGLLYVASRLNANGTEGILKDLRDWLFRHIQNLPMDFFSGITKGELIQRSTGDVETLRYFFEEHFVEMVRLTGFVVFTIVMMGTISWTYALLNVLMFPPAIYFGWLYYRDSSQAWGRHEAEADKLNGIIQENLSNIRLIQSFSKHEYEVQRFYEQSKRTQREGINMSLLNTRFGVVIDLIIYLQIIFSIFVGIYFVLQGKITIGELTAMYWLFFALSWPMKQINRVLAFIGMSKVAVNRIFEVLDAGSEHKDEEPSELVLKGKIEFKNVSFKYKKSSSQWALRNVSFTILPGENVAVTGTTGAGKSTLINLLLRFYEPDEGVILLDDIDIRQISRKTIRRQIGVAFQHPFLFSTSLKENIRYGFPEASDADITHISDIAEVSNILDDLPNGIDSSAGEKGNSLSGGQRQRVALARTLMGKPGILVLDDITSALDATTEQRLFNQLNEHMNGRTVIMIAHRPVSIQRASKVLVLNKGELKTHTQHIFNTQSSFAGDEDVQLTYSI